MEIISVKVGSPSQSTNVDIEKPSQVKAEIKNVTINTSGDGASNAVLYDPQDLTDAQKRQARSNISAVGQDEMPTKTSNLTNDSGFITRVVNNLANYYLKSETYSKQELDNKISAIPKFSIEVVGSLPTTGISDTTVYLLASGNEQDNLYTEYIYVNGAWEYLGKQTVDLTGYVKRTELSAYYTSIEIDSLLTTIRNSIPTKLSQLTEDSSHRVVTDAEKQSWNAKANKSTTLAGYGITDGATKTQVEQLSEEIANETTARKQAISELEVKMNQMSLNFAVGDDMESAIEWLKANGDTSLTYAVPDETDPEKSWFYQYTYVEGTNGIAYTNQIPISTDTSGAIYNGKGYKENTRIGSDGTDRTGATGIHATGYIPVKKNDDVFLSNCQMLKDATNNQFALYKSDKSFICYRNVTNVTETYWGGEFDSNNYLTKLKINDGSNVYDLSDVGFIRFAGNYIGADSIITVNEEIKETTSEGGYQWVNTGRSLVQNDYEDRIADLEAENEEQDERIESIEETLKKGVVVDDGVPDYVKTEAREVADKIISTRTANSLVLLKATDIHWIASEHANFENNRIAVKHLGMGMKEVRKQTKPDAVVLLGDYVYNTTPLDKEQAKKAMKGVVESLYDATNGITSIWLDGNHDYYEHDEADKDYRLTDGEHYALVGANNSQDVEVDADNVGRNYGYIDFKKQRIRLIYLNTTDISGDVYSANYITNTQGQWLINTALDMTSKDDAEKWGIVVCSHFPIYSAPFTDLKSVLCAYKDKTSGTNYGVSYNFSSVKAELITTFHGHIHNFKVTDVTTNGGNTIKAICIPNSCPDRENPYTGDFQEVDASGNPVSYPKTAGTSEDTSFNAVIIDRDNQKIHAICYGAGYDREISY